MKSIYEFNRGEIITRIIPSKSRGCTYSLDGVLLNKGIDRSYMGDKLIFVGIANGQIYFKNENPFHKEMFGDKLSNVALDLFDEGWDYYVDPNSLLDGLEINYDKDQLIIQYNTAVADENYELAKILKGKIDKL
jgi:hypothetical protein